MNITISGLLIIFLILPGIIYRKFYFTEEFSKQYFTEKFHNLLISTFISSILLHGVVLLFVNKFGYRLDMEILGRLITSKDYNSEIIENIENNKINILKYFLLLVGLSIVSGVFFKLFIRKLKFDRKFKIFRFKNSWHYTLTGEFFDFKRAAFELDKHKTKDIDIKYVTVFTTLTNTEDETYI